MFGGRQKLTGQDIARTVTISGNNKTIDFTDQALDLTDDNQGENNDAWNITFEDVNIKADSVDVSKAATDHASYSPISLTKVSAKNQAKDTITFKNVTANVTGRPVITGMITNSAGAANTDNEKYTLVLEGTNDLTSTAYTGGLTPGDDGDAISAGYIVVKDGITTVNMPQTDPYNLQYGGAAVRATQNQVADDNGNVTKYSVDVKQGATLNINGGTDVKGIVASGTGANLVHGYVNIDGNVNMNLGDGHSIAMWTGNLNVGKTGDLEITTAMTPRTGNTLTTFNSGQFGVLSIGTAQPGTANITTTDSVLNDNGIIKITRTSTDKGISPMISMGNGSSQSNNTMTININEGATLDLQDNENQTNLGMIFINGWVGGPSGQNLNAYININNPKYVNLQRLNTLPSNGGAFIFNERTNQATTVTNSPIAQWDAANMTDTPNYTWMVTNSQSRGTVGMHAGEGFAPIGFNPQKTIVAKASPTYLTSNGSVIMAPSQAGTNSFQYDGSQKANKNTNQGVIKQGAGNLAYYTPYLNQFLNNFSWWTPQRLAFGSQLLEKDSPVKSNDNDMYEPEVQTIKGTTKQTLSDLDPNKGIKDLLKASMDDQGTLSTTTVPTDGIVKSVTWYDSADADEWKKLMGDEAEPTNPTGDLKTTDKSAWAKVTYDDGTVDFANIPLDITDAKDSVTYQPSYKPADVKQGGTVTTDVPTYTTSTEDGVTINPDGKAPAGTKYSISTDATLPEGVTATVDPDTGAVTVQTSDNTPEGPIEIPVTVTYPDGTEADPDAETVYAPIIVGGTTFIGTDYTVTVYADLKNLHETSDNSMYPDAKDVITKVVYWNNKDLAAGKNLGGTLADLNSGVSVEWTKAPNTVVDKASMSADLPGTGTDTVSDENPALKISFANDSDFIQKIGKYLVLNDDYGWSQTLQWYGDPVVMQGAAPVADAASKKLEVDPAKKGATLTAEEEALINKTNLNKLTANKPTSYTWANDLNAGDTQGTVKITFNDKDKDGNPTYLYVELPAGSLDVKEPEADTSTVTINYVNNDDHSNIVKSTPVEGKVGDPTNITKESIDNGAPENWQVVGGQSIEVPDKFGSKDSTLTVYVEHKTENIPVDKSNKDTYREVTQTIISVDPTTGAKETLKTTTVPFQRTGVKDMVTGDITWNAWEGPEGSKTVEGVTSYEIPEFNVPAKTGYDSYVNGTKEAEIPAVSVNPDSSNITDTITYAKKGTETKKVDPTNPSDPNQKDLFKTVTRTINIPTPNADGKITDNSVIQTITFGRTKIVDVKTGKAISYSSYTVYNTDTNTLTNDSTGTFPEKDIPQVNGYTSNVDGEPTTTVQAVEDVTPDTPNLTVNVTYAKKGEQGHTEAEEKTPQGGTISVPEGHELTPTDAKDAIENNGDLKDVKSYTWDPADTPSTDTPGNKAGTVVVTYNNGTEDKVPVVVNVKSQAETYDPQGQDVHTTVGGDPQAVEGIKNADDMPKGTTYTWTNKLDTSKPGTVSTVVNVIYPDHSVDQVPVKVIIGDGTPTDNTKKTDADSNDPQGQTVNTVIGTVPPAEDGIKNKNDMPEGTTYTWSGTPDVYTKGNHPGVVKVTYPDKSVDYVPVTVNVTNEPTGKPTTIEQGGQVPDAPTVIDWGNGSEPSNTTITWEKEPDPSTPGDQQGTVKITYPDGQTTTVVVPVTVIPKTPSADDDFNPTANPLNLPYGADVPAAEDQINPDSTNGYKITKAHWIVEPDTTKPGLQLAHISVTGTKDGKEVTKDVPVYVHVGTEADSYDPKGQDFSTPLNSDPAATKGIVSTSVPSTATITWALAPNTSTTGVKPSLIKVTYSDGSVDYVPVNVTVTDNNGGNSGDEPVVVPPTDDPTPIPQDIHTPKGVVPDPEDGIKNKDDMPDGTTYTWKDTPDVDAEGKHPAVIVVTYPDGKTVDVPVTVIVDKDKTSDKNKDTKPEPKPITTDQGKLPDPSDGIKNKDDMPDGTKYSWKKTPDVSKPGTRKVTIIVTYPDGKTAEVTTTITVVKTGAAIGGNGSANGVSANGSTDNGNSNNGNGSVKAASKNGEEGQLPQTGASDNSKAGIFGLALAAIAGLFGLAGDRKRKDN